jgi:Concanavalin A-like lectin/glucanases superfamily
VVYDRDSGITVYVDGSSRTTAGAFTGDIGNAAAFLVGKATSYGYFSGDLDEIAVYPHVLSAARVGAHFSTAHGSH